MIPGEDIRHSLAGRQLPVLLVALAVALAVVAGSSVTISAQSAPTSISGRVVQGTAGAVVPAGLNVVLLVVDEARQEIISTDQAIVGTNGVFGFDDLLSGPGLTYRVAVDGGEYTPSVDLVPGESDFANVEVIFYEQTRSFDDIRVSTFSILVPTIDGSDRLMGMLGVVNVVNSGDRVWVPDTNNPNLTGLDLLRFNLPEGYSDLSVESSLPPGNMLEISTGFAMTNPVPPGEHDVLMTFLIDYPGSTLDFPLRLPYGADQVRIMVPEGSAEISGLGLGAAEGAIIEDTAYSVVTGQGYARGSQLDVQLSSLPTPSPLENVQAFFEGRGYVVVLAWVAGAALLGLLVYAFFFARNRRTPAPEPDMLGYPEYAHLTRDEIVQTIATLDGQRDAGALEDEEYSSRRAYLTRAALAARVTEAT